MQKLFLPQWLWLPVLLMLSIAAVAAEQQDLTELSLEQLLTVEVINAARLGQKTNEAPASISVVTANDIRTFGWRNLAEALNAMRSLYTSNDRNYSYLGVRGINHHNDYNSRVLLMIDGQRMNENIFDGGYLAQEFMLDIDLIERIEFIPGSGSSIYGANAFYGLINVITKKGHALNGAQLAGEYGRYDTYKGRVSYGKTLENGTDVLLSASHYDSAGVENLYFPAFDRPETNHGIAENMDAERADRLFARVEYDEYTFMAGFVDRFKRVPNAAFGAIFNDPEFHTNDRQFFGNLKYEKALNEETSLRVKGFYQGYDYDADQAYFDERRIVNYDAASGRWLGGEAQLTSTHWQKHRLMLGLEYQFDQRQRILNYDLTPYTPYLDSQRSGHRVQLYAQDDIQIWQDWIFSAGLRLDYHHMLKDLQLNPRLGLIWSPSQQTTFKWLYSSSFRAPNVWERDYQSVYTQANPYNYEERIKSYEAVAEWRFEPDAKLVGNLFYNQISQLLEQQEIPVIGSSGRFENTGAYRNFGLELEAEKRWHNGRLLKAAYVYSRLTEESRNDSRGVGSPYNLFKVHYAEPLFDDFVRLGIENIFVDERLTPQGTNADAYHQLNVNLSSQRLLPGTELSFGLYNLFDTRYQMLGGTGLADIQQDVIPMNGREFRLRLQVTF